MRRPPIAAALSLAALSLAALAIAALAAAPGFAQQGLPTPPGGGLKPPPPAPVKPYQQVAVTPPAPFNDPGFVALRKQLADVVAKKDRAALAKLIVAQNFFWIQDRDLADKHKPGIENLAKAIDLDAKDGSGWDTLNGLCQRTDRRAGPAAEGRRLRAGQPDHRSEGIRSARQGDRTEPSEWGYPTNGSVDVHAAAQPNSPVTEKLGMILIRVLPDSAQPTNPNEPFFLHVATPSGKTGFVDAQALSPLGGDEMCYSKDASGWKIAGYLGGVSQ